MQNVESPCTSRHKKEHEVSGMGEGERSRAGDGLVTVFANPRRFHSNPTCTFSMVRVVSFSFMYGSQFGGSCAVFRLQNTTD